MAKLRNVKTKASVETGEILSPEDKNLDIPLARLSKDQQSTVRKIMQEIDVDNSQEIIQYGVGAQSEISQFADHILTTVRSKDTGFVGDTLTDLMLKVQDLNVDGLSYGHPLSKIPFIGKLFDSGRAFIARYETLSSQITSIVNNLERAKTNLLKDITLLDGLYMRNIEYLRQIELYIVAGNLKIEELYNEVLPALKVKADKGDQADIQKFNDMVNLVTNFERKIHDLKLTRMIAIQMAPQIRIVQSNDQSLAEKIQSSVLTTIPLWKSQIVLAITALRQKKALEVQRKVTNTTNQLLRKNSEMLKENAIGVAKELERGVVDIETLQKSQQDLITTIEETLKIQQEGRNNRMVAEQELVKMEGELKDKLTKVHENKI